MAGLALPFLLPEVVNPDLRFKKYLNFLLAMMARRCNATHVLSKPFDISINPSTACQLQCPYCETGNGTMSRPATNLPVDLHRQMISQVVDELFVARYFGTGESLLNKRFADLLLEIKQKEIFSFITTNFSFKFSDKQIDELIDSGLNLIGISLDGIEQKTYAQYRVGGNCALVIDNMCRLIKRRNDLGRTYPLVQWRYLVFKHNAHEVETVRQLSDKFGVDLLEFVQGFAPKDGSGVVQMVERFDLQPSIAGPALRKAVLNKRTPLQKLIMQHKYEHHLPPKELKYQKCDWHYLGSYWYPDGGVGPCCIATDIKEDFGKVTPQEGFNTVWNGELYKDARSLISGERKNDSFCGSCRNKGTMDKFFITSIRGILLNAPNWVLKILSSDPECFFHPIDHYYFYNEIRAITNNHGQFAGDYEDIVMRMRTYLESNIEKERYVTALLMQLEEKIEIPQLTIKQRISKLKGEVIYNLHKFKHASGW